MTDLGPLFAAPQSPDRFWIVLVLLAVPSIITGVIVFVRGRLPAVLSSYVMLMIPAFAYVLGDLHVLDESKQVQFCGSCHTTMSPVVAAMKSDSGEFLSTLHYQSGAVSHVKACYQCHSGYGIWGGYHAKQAGIMHMVHTLTGDFEYPIRTQRNFDIASCLGCHAEAKPFRAVEEHRDEDVQEALLSQDMICTDCHVPAHPEEALMGVGHEKAAARSGDDGEENKS